MGDQWFSGQADPGCQLQNSERDKERERNKQKKIKKTEKMRNWHCSRLESTFE